MIIVTERFFLAQEQWAPFEEHCQRLGAIMAGQRGCYHHCLVRGPVGSASHILYSLWESLERFQQWTRSDAFVLAANGALAASFLAPRQAEVQILFPMRPRPSGLPPRCPGAAEATS
jgi:heme-degrading monooxygenase HmoA